MACRPTYECCYWGCIIIDKKVDQETIRDFNELRAFSQHVSILRNDKILKILWNLDTNNNLLFHDQHSSDYRDFRSSLRYVVEDFFKPRGYNLNGMICWVGDSDVDEGQVIIENNTIKKGTFEEYLGNSFGFARLEKRKKSRTINQCKQFHQNVRKEVISTENVPSLQEICLKIVEESIEDILGCTNCSSLDLSFFPLDIKLRLLHFVMEKTNSSAQHIKNLGLTDDSIVDLQLKWSRHHDLLRFFPNLKKLDIWELHKKSVGQIKAMKKLTHLSMNGAAVPMRKILGCIGSQLKVLKIQNIEIPFGLVKMIRDSCCSLEELILNDKRGSIVKDTNVDKTWILHLGCQNTLLKLFCNYVIDAPSIGSIITEPDCFPNLQELHVPPSNYASLLFELLPIMHQAKPKLKLFLIHSGMREK